MFERNLDTAWNNARPPIERYRERYDLIVGMNDKKICLKGQSIMTYGLGGCIAGFVEGTEDITLFHYDPTSLAQILSTTFNLPTDTKQVCFCVPGEYVKEDGRYVRKPQDFYLDALASILKNIRAQNIDVKIYTYSEDMMAGLEDQGTFGLNKSGDVLVDACSGSYIEDNALHLSGSPAP